jgi:hypothetical protein
VKDMPKLVKNYLLITYDDLVSNFGNTMKKIKNYKLPVKSSIKFPINISYYKKETDQTFVKKDYNEIDEKIIVKKANLHFEKILFDKK